MHLHHLKDSLHFNGGTCGKLSETQRASRMVAVTFLPENRVKQIYTRDDSDITGGTAGTGHGTFKRLDPLKPV